METSTREGELGINHVIRGSLLSHALLKFHSSLACLSTSRYPLAKRGRRRLLRAQLSYQGVVD